jgi:hypothetical protein
MPENAKLPFALFTIQKGIVGISYTVVLVILCNDLALYNATLPLIKNDEIFYVIKQGLRLTKTTDKVFKAYLFIADT